MVASQKVLLTDNFGKHKVSRVRARHRQARKVALQTDLGAPTPAGALERQSHNGWCPRSQLGWWNFLAAPSQTCSVPTRFDVSVFRAISER